MKQKIEELDNVILKLTTKKLTAKEIVKKAVKSIESNLSQLPHSYIGYYRDYQIYKNGDYYNLNEGIIEQFDKGILSHKLFDNENQSVLYLFKPNLNYKVDYYLASAYNNKDKYIQDFKIFNFGGNELSILNAHNPIRIFNDKSFSYVNNLEDDFFLNHTFKKGKVFKAENEKFITINFKGRKSKIYSKHKVEGKIIISLYDYSIHNFKYIIYKNIEKTPILNIDIAYKKRNDFMYLNYMSFNNKFYIEEKEVFKEKESIFNEEDGRFEIEFNSNVNLKTLKKSNFKVSYNDKKIVYPQTLIIK